MTQNTTKVWITIFSPYSCAIIQQTANGTNVGRCYHYVGQGPQFVCPTHGDVTQIMNAFHLTGNYTLEEDFKRSNATNG